MQDWTVWAIGALAIFVGATLQRVSGMGPGLVVAPGLAVLLGPVAGVLLTNITTTISGFLIMATVWRRVNWKRAAALLGWAIPGAILGALVVRVLPAAWLTILVGAIVLAALIVIAIAGKLTDWLLCALCRRISPTVRKGGRNA